jgi:hypothetical protein
MSKPFRRGLRSEVGLVAGEAQASAQVSPEGLQASVQRLLVAAS